MSDAQCGCQCCPNKKNAWIISAQVLSIAAFATGYYPGYLSFGLWFQFAVFFIALGVFIFHQVLWCVTAPKGVYWALSFLSLFLAFSSIGSGIWWFTLFPDGWEFYGILWIVSGVLWLIATILEFVYVCKKDESKENTVDEEDNLDEESGNQRHTNEEGVAVAE